MSNYYLTSKALAHSSIGRTPIEFRKWGWILIAIIAVLAADTLLAAGAWFAVGYIIG